MVIARALLDRIVAHARRDFPNECCGMIATDDGRAVAGRDQHAGDMWLADDVAARVRRQILRRPGGHVVDVAEVVFEIGHAPPEPHGVRVPRGALPPERGVDGALRLDFGTIRRRVRFF